MRNVTNTVTVQTLPHIAELFTGQWSLMAPTCIQVKYKRKSFLVKFSGYVAGAWLGLPAKQRLLPFWPYRPQLNVRYQHTNVSNA